jgi:hypothetical protein
MQRNFAEIKSEWREFWVLQNIICS